MSSGEAVDVSTSDKIGFTCEQQICPISYQPMMENDMIYTQFEDDNYPQIGNTYSFDTAIAYPAKFAFGLVVAQGEKNDIYNSKTQHPFSLS